jgi:CelD/BcsL family acetyltransferase involved in cellulose biosynthesis
MRMNGRPIAVDISYGSRDRVFGHFLTYDASFRKFGPGILMADFSIRAAQEQGYKVFDLCPPEQPYKLQMCDQRVEVCEWARALSGKGKLIVWLRRWRLQQAAKMAFRYVPRRMRQLLSSLYARGK